MEKYSEQDLRYAAEFRDGIHREALAEVRKVYPEVDAVIDRYPVESYFQEHWDYPGKWYTVVSIPYGCGGRKALIRTIVRDTLDHHRAEPSDTTEPAKGKPFTATNGQRHEPDGDDTDAAFLPDDPFYEVIAAYPDCEIDYCLVAGEPQPCLGSGGHRRALERACRRLFAPDEDGDAWRRDVSRAVAKRIDAGELFSSEDQKGKLTYRKAFLHPPHENGYSDADFAKVNAVLFPNGTDGLDVYEWTTDWSDYFDEGHEWWGALCLTVYDRSLNRFAVILASATD